MFRPGWKPAKTYFLAICTAGLLRFGIGEISSAVAYPVAGVTVRFVNWLLRRSLPDHLLLNDSFLTIPWTYHLKTVAGGVIVVVLAMFLGLLANVRLERR